MTLVKKMAMLIFSVAGLACLVLAVLITMLVQGPIKHAAEERQQTVAKRLMNSIDRSLFERYRAVQDVAKDPYVIDAAARPTRLPTVRLANKQLQALMTSGTPWQAFDVVDTKGNIIASSDDARPGSSVKQKAPYASLIKDALGGQTVYANPYDDTSLKTIVMPFLTPIEASGTSRDGAVLVGYMKWQSFLAILGSVDDTTVLLYNGRQLIGDHQHPDAILKQDPSPSAALGVATRGMAGTMLERVDNQEVLSAYASQHGFQEFDGSGWVLVIQDPATRVFAAAKTTTTKIIITLVVVVVVGATAAVLLVSQVVRPVGMLTVVTQKIASGDLSQRVTVKKGSEYGRLAETFNSMADKLQQVYEGLERKIAEKTAQLALKVEEVEAEKVKDEALLSSIGEGMVAVDADGTVVRINQPAVTILGVPEKSLLGHRITQAVAFTDDMSQPVPAESQPGFLALHHGQKTEDTFQINRADNAKAAVTITSSPIRLQHRTIGVIMVIRDVTKEREVDRMKTEFISLASHQLRTPLSAIRWFSEMLLSGDAGELLPEQKEFAQNISESTDRMIQLVSSLLNISRIESGRIIIDPRATDMKGLIDGIVNDLHAKIEERNQHLAISVHNDLDKVNLDPRMIGQVYLNLLTNAIKYTPKGGDITVIVSKRDNQIISQISDNGYGIPKDQQGKMFQKFFRADNVAKIETDGTGLGMYLVKAIVESSGGQIWFQSEEGKGTTFWFSLPAAGMKAKAGEVSLDS